MSHNLSNIVCPVNFLILLRCASSFRYTVVCSSPPPLFMIYFALSTWVCKLVASFSKFYKVKRLSYTESAAAASRGEAVILS